MAYQATIIPVMIASPSDVEVERRIVRVVLHEWNDVNSKSRMIAFMPVAWETHASPGLDGRPQDLINKHLLEDCDLLIGVFWTRAGTPTGKEQSGTIEEIKKHHAEGKPAMIYFSSKPVSPGDLDQNQYDKVLEFKAWCKLQGLIVEYSSERKFREKLSKHLPIILQQNEYLKDVLDEYPIQMYNSEVTVSSDAQEMLLAATETESGTILAIRVLSGYSIQAGGKSFGGTTGRENARWKGALDELVECGLAEDRGFKGEVFELTHLGWKMADHFR